MASLDVPSLRNLRVFLATLDRLQVEAEHVPLVLNKAEVGTGIDIAKLQNIYPQGFTSVLPYDIEVTRSINRGQPVIMSAPNAPVSRKFIEGAMRLVEPAEGVEFHWDDAKPARQGLFARLFGHGREHRPQILQEGVMT